MIREAPSGIDLLVVGAGPGGLSAAIECHRKGHNVRVIERRPDFNTFGTYHHHPQQLILPKAPRPPSKVFA